MFLKELFLFSRVLFISFISFIVLFLFLNIKWGVVAFPVNEYGMYSGKLHVSDTQQVYRIYTNDQLVDFSKLSMSQRDMLQYSLDFYKTEKANNAAVYATMNRLLKRFFIGSFMKEENYTNKTEELQFYQWFQNRLGRISGTHVSRMAIFSQKYLWDKDSFKPVSEPLKIISIESYQ